jgi:hypothetical protein
MDILNFISWIKGKRQVTSVDPAKTLLPVGLKDPRRDDEYLAGAISVQDLITQIGPNILYSATFFDTTTQSNGGATVANQVLINSTQQSNGFTLGPNNRINVLNAGTYYLDFAVQLSFTGGASSPYNVTIWFTIDDVIVPNSAFTFTTTGAQNDQTLGRISDTVTLTAGQYIKFYWWSAVTGMKLFSTPVGTNPTRPLSPSVNFTIFNVG